MMVMRITVHIIEGTLASAAVIVTWYLPTVQVAKFRTIE